MTGICALISVVMSAQADPGPNVNGCGVVALNGVPSSTIDLTCASSMT